MSNKLFVSLFFLSLCIVKSSVAFSFEHPDSLQSHEPKHNSIDSLILQTSENYSCTLIHNSFSKYDVLISKPNCGYSNIYNVPGVFNYGYHAYSLYLDNAISKPLLDTGISISKLNILLGTNREQIVFLDHSQRISKNIKIEVSYHSIVSLGFLTNELSKSKSFDLDLYCTKKFYQNNFGFHYRKIDVEENGGIVEGQKTAGLTKNKFDLLAVQLNSDKSYSSINNFFLQPNNQTK